MYLGKRLHSYLVSIERYNLTLENGILLFIIGMSITVIGFYIAYTIGSRELEKRTKPKSTNPIDEFRERIDG